MVSKELLIHGGSAYGIIKITNTDYKTAFLVKHYFEKHYTHTCTHTHTHIIVYSYVIERLL